MGYIYVCSNIIHTSFPPEVTCFFITNMLQCCLYIIKYYSRMFLKSTVFPNAYTIPVSVVSHLDCSHFAQLFKKLQEKFL